MTWRRMGALLAALTIVSCSTGGDEGAGGTSSTEITTPATDAEETTETTTDTSPDTVPVDLAVDQCPGTSLGTFPLAIDAASAGGSEPAAFVDVATSPAGIVFVASEQTLYCIDDSDVYEVQSLDPSALPDAAEEPSLAAVAVDVDGAPLAIEHLNPRVLRLVDGGFEIVSGSDEPAIGGSRSATVGPDGTIYMTGLGPSGSTFVWAIRGGTPEPFAGTGPNGTAGDGGPALDANFYEPEGLAAPSDGSLLVADRNNQRVVRIGPDGVVETLAGGRRFDDRPDSEALEAPSDVAVDLDGEVLVLERPPSADGPPGIYRIVAPDEVELVLGSDGYCEPEIEAGASEACAAQEYDADDLYRFDVAADGSYWLVHTSAILRFSDGKVEAILAIS